MKPQRYLRLDYWIQDDDESVPYQGIENEVAEAIIGRELTWEDEPVEIGVINHKSK